MMQKYGQLVLVAEHKAPLVILPFCAKVFGHGFLFVCREAQENKHQVAGILEPKQHSCELTPPVI